MKSKYSSELKQILEKIKTEVHYKYPNKEGDKKGYLKDRCVLSPDEKKKGVPYWDVIDLIVFPNEPKEMQENMRIGYYRKPKDRLVWGSQTTITEPLGVWKKLLIKAANEKIWFRELLEEVIDDVKKKKK